jgi:hypothetical protein
MRLIVEGLYQGNINDLNILAKPEYRERLGFTLAINVGSTPWVPRALPTFALPMFDIVDEDDPLRSSNNWALITDALLAAAGEVTRGGKVLVVCDAGISRSVVFYAMAVSVLEGIPMMVDVLLPPLGPVMWIGPIRPELPRGIPPQKTINRELMEMLRTPNELEPSHALWKDAAKALQPLLDDMDRLRQ